MKRNSLLLIFFTAVLFGSCVPRNVVYIKSGEGNKIPQPQKIYIYTLAPTRKRVNISLSVGTNYCSAPLPVYRLTSLPVYYRPAPPSVYYYRPMPRQMPPPPCGPFYPRPRWVGWQDIAKNCKNKTCKNTGFFHAIIYT